MPYPAALGQRPLEVREAYEALEQYAADYGREPLLLLMHASVPETLRADLLNLIRLNFMPGRGSELSLEADVLFSPLCTALGGGYYRIDAQVRWHGLALLRSRYRDDPRPRVRRVAELLWRYIESTEHQAARAADPQLSEFLAIQRWVALAFLEPAGAAHAFADALRQGGEAPGAAAVMRLGGLASAIELPLANEPELIAYARGLDALVSGDEGQARSLLEGLGEDEIHVGDIALKSPVELLRQQFPDAVAQAPAVRRKTCVLIQGTGVQRDASTGRNADADRVRERVRAAVEAAGFGCVRAEDLKGERELYAHLLSADLVVCDPVTAGTGAPLLLGVRLALRPQGVILVAAVNDAHAFQVSHAAKWVVQRDADDKGGQQRPDRFEASLHALAAAADRGETSSSVYLSLPGLMPPVLGNPDEPIDEPPLAAPEGVNRNRCLVIQSFGSKTDPRSGRTLDFDASYRVIKAAVGSAGLECVRLDEGTSLDHVGMFTMLREAGLVIADLTMNPRGVLFQLGVRFGLQPSRTILVAENDLQLPQELRELLVLHYPVDSSGQIGVGEAHRFRSKLESRIRSVLAKPIVDSPVYAALPHLQPPRMKEPAAAPSVFVDRIADSPPPRPKVFISYSRPYVRYVRLLVAALKGVDVSWDMDLEAGDNWEQRLAEMLAAADGVISVAGGETQQRHFPLAEIERSIELGKRLIPVLVEPFEQPGELRSRICANLDADGKILYLGQLQGEELEAAVALSARNILKALGVVQPGDVGVTSESVADIPTYERSLIIRREKEGELHLLLVDKENTHSWSLDYVPARMASLVQRVIREAPLRPDTVRALVQQLLPPELASLPPALSYRLALDRELAPLPWELVLAFQPDVRIAPIPVNRQLVRFGPVAPLRSPRGRALLIGNTSAAPELAGIARSLRSRRFSVDVPEAVDSGEAMTQLFSGDFDVLVISSHTAHDRQAAAGFIPGYGHLPTALDIRRMKNPPDLVFLNDCQLGAVKERHPNSSAGELVPALLESGVRCVLAAAWAVDERVAAIVADHFFLLLARGSRFEDAAAMASRAAFDGAPELGSWAAYQCWGDPDFKLSAPAAP